MPIVAQILSSMSGLSGPQRNLLLHLMSLWPCIRGRFNFLNLCRYSSYCERTLRRHFARSFEWGAFNARLLDATVAAEHELMLALEASFVPKSGRHTPGRGWFSNGLAGRSEKGLELSLVSVVDLTHNTAYALHAQQSLPPEAEAEAEAESACKDVEHLRQTQPHWPARVRHLAADGAYTRRPFVDGVCALGLEMVGKLRRDANLRYLFQGKQKPRGRRRLYDAKVLWKQFEPQRWHDEGEVEPGVHLYSACLFHLSLKRVIKVALLQKAAAASASASTGQVLLFSTDLSLSGRQIVRMYRARFQIEFLFRDAKGGAGLTHCQSRQEAALHFHWNMAFAALNLAKAKPIYQAAPQPPRASRPRFSWRSVQQQNANQHFLHLFSSKLDLDWNLIQTHPNFPELCNYGVIAP